MEIAVLWMDSQLNQLRKLITFSNLLKKIITEEELNYFTYKYKKATNFRKLCLFSQRTKIHKHKVNLLGCSVVSNCGMSTEEDFEFLDHHLQSITRPGMSQIKETNGLLLKIKILIKVPINAILVTNDVDGLASDIDGIPQHPTE